MNTPLINTYIIQSSYDTVKSYTSQAIIFYHLTYEEIQNAKSHYESDKIVSDALQAIKNIYLFESNQNVINTEVYPLYINRFHRI